MLASVTTRVKEGCILHSTNRTFQLVLSAMLITLVFVATLFLNIKLPIAANGGLVHLGSAMLFVIAILFGPKYGFIAGAFGMGLFDLVAGWTLWAPFTFITRGLQGYIVGKIAWGNGRSGQSTSWNVTAILVSIPFMLAGYYVCERVLYNSWVIPFASIPGNLVQNSVGLAIAVPVAIVLKRVTVLMHSNSKLG